MEYAKWKFAFVLFAAIVVLVMIAVDMPLLFWLALVLAIIANVFAHLDRKARKLESESSEGEAANR